MFVKAIRFRDVKKGDVVSSCANYLHEVSEVEVHTGYVVLHTKATSSVLPGGKISGHPDEFIGLVNLQYQDGKTEEDMLNEVLVKLIETCSTENRAEFAKRLPAFREAIETYELGKPLDDSK
jgi:hypothetical protein